MKRFTTLSLFLAVLLFPLLAQAQRLAVQSTDPPRFIWSRAYMRNTTAANAVAREPNWMKGIPGAIGFSDSLVFRRAVTTLTVYDTTQGYAVEELAFPPHLQGKGGTTALADSAQVNPWIGIRVRQDTTSYGYASTSALDSVHVCAQWSIDGINWNAVAGTPTVQPSAAFFTSGEDGIAPLGVKAPELTGPASDVCEYLLTCNANEFAQSATTLIFNKTLCEAPGYIRFIIGMDGTGQFAVDIGKWIKE